MFDHRDYYQLLQAVKEHLTAGGMVVTEGGGSGVGPSGEQGKSLQFEWKGTKLGIRVEGEKYYKYVDLKGADGSSPTIDPTTKHWILDGIDTGISAEGKKGNDGVSPEFKVGTVKNVPATQNAAVKLTKDTNGDIVIDFEIPKGVAGDPATNTDEKVKMDSDTTAKYLSQWIDNNTIVMEGSKAFIKVKTLDGLNVTVAELNYIKGLDKHLMTYLSALSNSMTFRDVVPNDVALSSVSDAEPGDTYIVKASESNGGVTMTFIYNGTDFVAIAETSVTVRDFTVNPIDLTNEVTGKLPKEKIDDEIARTKDVLTKAEYEGSATGVVKAADTLVGLGKRPGTTIDRDGTDVASALDKAHEHTNKAALDNVKTDQGDDTALYGDGAYKKPVHIGNSAPVSKKSLWVDTTTASKPVIKFWDGSSWVAASSVSSGSGSTVTIDSVMSASSANPVQNKVIKKYVDDSIPGISTQTKNAISADASGDYYAEDKTSDIAENRAIIDTIKRHEKYVNTSLDYCEMGFKSIQEIGSSSNTRFITAKVNCPISFDKCMSKNNMDCDVTKHTIKLHGGKTYRLSSVFKGYDPTDMCMAKFYNETDNVYFRNASVAYKTDYSNSILEEIVTPIKDIDVSVRLAWINEDKMTGINIRVCTTNTNASGVGLSPSATPTSEAWFIAEEIGREIEIDPLDYVDTESGIEDTPVGTIISVMGTKAPAHYLVCDGTEKKIADYPELADYFKDQFGSISHFGGNGTTTFNVPDLRGEFLRGSGVNGHANQGSGADPGVHQNATQVPRMWADGNKNVGVAHLASIINYDTGVGSAYNFFVYGTDKNNYGPSYQSLTVRPTNTSILWCIKAEPTYYMKVEGRELYSMEKHFVGYWIDGKPLYEKTVRIDGATLKLGAAVTVPHDIKNYDFITVSPMSMMVDKTNNASACPIPFGGGGTADVGVWTNGANINIHEYNTDRSDMYLYIVLRWTEK